MKTVTWYCSNCSKKVEIKEGARQKIVDGCQCKPDDYKPKIAPAFIGATKSIEGEIPVELMNPQLDQIRCFKAMAQQSKLSAKDARYWKQKLGHIKSFNYKGEAW